MSAALSNSVVFTERELNPVFAFREIDHELKILAAEAVAAWKKSKGEQIVERTVKGLGSPDRTVVTKRQCFGEVRFLHSAMRLERARFDAACHLAKVNHHLAAKPSQTENAPATPCARETASETVATPPAANTNDVSQSPETPCDESVFPEMDLFVPESTSPTPVRARQLRRQRERELRRKMSKAG